jgi:putative phage-type endonuclease
MSFGNLSLMLEKTIKILNKDIELNNTLNLSDLYTIKKKVYLNLQKEFDDISMDKIDEIFNRLFSSKYQFNGQVNFDNGINCFREFEDTYPDIKVPSKYKKLDEHFNKLKNLPQPAQRSKEWYDYRFNRITASDSAAAIDLNPYEPVESFILKKCDPNFPFRDNATVFHGKKYEPTATMIYEHIYNTRVFEFGALPSDKYNFLGASPDGISSKYTLDNKFSDRLGTMLEIKCPVTREIQTSGDIAGDICPFYYYCQVQQQLACCDLDKCDFWQCKLIEYKSRQEYLVDDCSSCINTIDNKGAKIQIDNRLKKGIILEFYPKNFIPEFDGDQIEWKSKYIIPKRLDMDDSQYNEWVLKTLDQYKETHPEIAKDYYFYRIIYWKLEASHNVTINRNDKFLENMVPILKQTWNDILYYRANQNKLDELKKIVEKRQKYIKHNTNYTIHSDIIVKGKHFILDPLFNCKNFISQNIKKPVSNYNYKSNYKYQNQNKEKEKEKEKDYESDECDFIDDKHISINKPKSKIETIEAKPQFLLQKAKPFDESMLSMKKNNVPSKVKQEQKNIESSNSLNDTNDCDFVD